MGTVAPEVALEDVNEISGQGGWCRDHSERRTQH